jgi:hypothetical protein
MSSKGNFFRKGSNIDRVGLGSIFDKPQSPNLPPEPEPIEEVTTITDDAGKAKRRKKKGIRQGGRQSTILSGISASLKKRLGE